MYAVIVRVELDAAKADEALDLLNTYTVPNVKQAPGFIAGTWTRSVDLTRGQSLILFETETTAQAAASRASEGPPPGAPVSFVSAEVFEVVAQA